MHNCMSMYSHVYTQIDTHIHDSTYRPIYIQYTYAHIHMYTTYTHKHIASMHAHMHTHACMYIRA